MEHALLQRSAAVILRFLADDTSHSEDQDSNITAVNENACGSGYVRGGTATLIIATTRSSASYRALIKLRKERPKVCLSGTENP